MAVHAEEESEREDDEESDEGGEAPGAGGMLLRIIGLALCLYFFMVGLSLMADAFNVLGGKEAGALFGHIPNPVMGLMIGILGTVLVQSSSTSTSIVVGLVSAGQLSSQEAVPVIMGANIGTSVTNTIVSMGQMGDRTELERAFAGATVHDMFNMLSVAVLMPLELVVGAMTGRGGPIFLAAGWIANQLLGGAKPDVEVHSPLKAVVSPVTSLILTPDKDVIKAYSFGEDVQGRSIIKSGLLKPLGAQWGGALALALSLVLLIGGLYFLVQLLHVLVMGRAKKVIEKATHLNDYLALCVGIVMTVVVQSSSVVTSVLTPLVGIGVLPVAKMFPMTLGANIGTTATALLAAVTAMKLAGMQIALSHLLFNIFGILIWFPLPAMRRVPIGLACLLGMYASFYRWVPLAYILTAFLLVPALALGITQLFEHSCLVGAIALCVCVLGAAAVLVWWNLLGGAYTVLSKEARKEHNDELRSREEDDSEAGEEDDEEDDDEEG